MRSGKGRDPETLWAKNARYWERHKEEVNARRREKYDARKARQA